MKKVTLTLLLLTLTITICKTQNTYRRLNHPLYILKLGNTRVISHYHTFISKINLKSIEDLLLLHQDQIQHCMGILEFEQRQQLIRLVNQSLNTLDRLKPLKREKRGIFNFVGTIYKDLFGLLDDDDMETINKKFEILLNNQHKITDDLNLKMSLLSKFIGNFNETINTLAANQEKISIAFKNLLITSNEILTVQINLNIIQNYLNNLEESINLSYVHILSKFILPPKDLLLLIKELGKLYGPNQILLFKNVQSYYPVIELTSIINENMDVIFTIKIPILQQTNFALYHVLPVPIFNQTIIPTFPYYLLSLTDYLGMDQECPKQEDVYLCPLTITTAHKQDCIPNMLKHHNTGTCPTIGIQILNPILQPIDQNKIVLVPVPEDPIEIIESCPNSIRHVAIQHPTEITITPNCSVSYDNQIFVNLPHKEKHLSVLLPSMNFRSNTTSALKLDNVNLNDISDLYKHFKSLQPLQIEDFPEDDPENHLPIIILSIIIFIIFLIILWIYCKSKKQPLNLKVAFTKSTPSATEKNITSQGNVGSHPTPSPSFIP